MLYDDSVVYNAGWKLFDKCRCGGVLQWKYLSGYADQSGWMIIIYPESNGYALMKNGSTSERGTLAELNIKMEAEKILRDGEKLVK